MATFDNILKASIGGTSLRLIDYSVKEDPQLKDGQGQIGTKVTITATGEVEAATPAAFGTALGQTLAALRQPSQNVVITGLDNVLEYQLLAASCIDGGPFVTVEVQEQMAAGAALLKPVKFTATGQTTPAGGGSGQQDKYQAETGTRADGLRSITYSGEIRGQGGLDRFNNTILPDLLKRYPKSSWVDVRRDVVANTTADLVTWSVTFAELLEPLPSSGTDTAVDGEVAKSVDRDEQFRLVEVLSFDLLVVGDAVAVLGGLRPTTDDDGNDVVILKEQYEITRHKEQRLRGSFTTLRGADGNELLNWEQTLETDQDVTIVEGAEYGAVEPVLVVTKRVSRWVQRGAAIGAGKYPKEPEILFPDNLAERPRIVFSPVNQLERKTEWTFTYVFKEPPKLSQAQLGSLERPASPDFYEIGGG